MRARRCSDGRRTELFDAPEPPLRLALGADAVDTIRGQLESLTAELSAWEAVSRDTTFDVDR